MKRTHTHTTEAMDYLTVCKCELSLLFPVYEYKLGAILQCVPLFRQRSMSLELSDILEKYLISDLVLWNKGCISQGRLTTVTNIPTSLWLSTITVCFSFTSQAEDRSWKILRAGAGNGIPPFFPHCGTCLHLNEKGLRSVTLCCDQEERQRQRDWWVSASSTVWDFQVRAVLLSVFRDAQRNPC